MVRLLADENFSGDVVRGLLLRNPGLDLVRVQDVGLRSRDDATILEWAAANGRLLITHDLATIPEHAYARVIAGRAMPGVFVINNSLPTALIIDDLLMVDYCSDPGEWDGLVIYLPL